MWLAGWLAGWLVVCLCCWLCHDGHHQLLYPSVRLTVLRGHCSLVYFVFICLAGCQVGWLAGQVGEWVVNNNNNDFISVALFHVKHAQLREHC